MSKIQKHEKVKVRMTGNGIWWVNATVIRTSKITGIVTVKLTEKRGAYDIGSKLNVYPYEIQRI